MSSTPSSKIVMMQGHFMGRTQQQTWSAGVFMADPGHHQIGHPQDEIRVLAEEALAAAVG
jgi:hypothetical protein